MWQVFGAVDSGRESGLGNADVNDPKRPLGPPKRWRGRHELNNVSVLAVGEGYMRRRDFIKAIAGSAVWPVEVRAQQSERMRRIGMLMSASESDAGYQSLLATFRDGLKKLGWEESRNIRIDFRWKAVDEESRQRLAKEVVALQPDLMLGQSTPTAAALLQ
jgi:hypothetical protein